jgi:tetratricopeptide (TPR) repeat protein
LASTLTPFMSSPSRHRALRGLALLAGLFAGLVSGEAPASVANERLSNARSQTAQLKFGAALEAASAALDAGDAEPEETAGIYALLGQVLSTMDKREEAIDAYAHALELSPGLALPPRTSPRISEIFAAARARLKGGTLKASPSSLLGSDGAVQTEVKIENDPLNLVTGATLHLPEGPRPMAEGDGFAAHWVCREAQCDWFVVLRDGKGNALKSLGTREAPFRVLRPVSSRPLYRRPAPYWIASAVAAAVGGLFAYRFADHQSQLAAIQSTPASHTFEEVRRLDALRQADRGLMWVGLGTAVGLGILAVALGSAAP